jgi:dienelactone hydrolase
MRAANKSVEIKIYHGAGHGFQNPDNTRGYRPGPAADAWSRTLAFFAHAQASPVLRSAGAEYETRGSSS